jgi:hypothetical protein
LKLPAGIPGCSGADQQAEPSLSRVCVQQKILTGLSGINCLYSLQWPQGVSAQHSVDAAVPLNAAAAPLLLLKQCQNIAVFQYSSKLLTQLRHLFTVILETKVLLW